MAGGHSFAAVVVLVASFLLTAPAAVNGQNANISTYWGTNSTEGRLEDACREKKYDIINIGFVDKFGNGITTPTLNLDGHCDPTSSKTDYENCLLDIGAEIVYCRHEGIKVFISLGGPNGNYTLSSEEDARWVALYVWFAFLDGRDGGVVRPFGNDTEANLDGVDLFVEDSTTQYWDVLAETLRSLSTIEGGQLELSATPKCSFPDKYLGVAIAGGYFDYLQVRFFNDSSCQYDGSFCNMFFKWVDWVYYANAPKVFVGVTASPDDSGYVDPTIFCRYFLQFVSKNSKFGGVMVWNRLTDLQSGYSTNMTECLIPNTTKVERWSI